METTINSTTEVLNDLIKINYDRIEGYRHAIEEIKKYDITLISVFQKMADESRLNVSALTGQVKKLGGNPEHGSTTLGKIYRAWMDVKAAIAGKDRKTILSSCKFGEDQAHNAYETALSTDAELDIETRQLIMSQKESLKKSDDEIKALRDLH